MKIISKMKLPVAFYRDDVAHVDDLLARCTFATGPLDLAVSGGADSVGMTLLAVAAGREVALHHVNHHLRPESNEDAELVRDLARDLGVSVTVYDVEVDSASNVESNARTARRAVLPPGTATGHTMDDLAETMLLNMLWGAGLDGLSPMVGDPTKPLLALRRAEVLDFVRASGRPYVLDPTNDDQRLRRNAVRHELLPAMVRVSGRDVVPILARQADIVAEERAWLDQLATADAARSLGEVDCRELQEWSVARVRRWLRAQLRSADRGDGTHPPSAAEIDRALAVVRGEVVATELSGGRRLARSGQHLTVHDNPPTTL